MEIRLAEGVAKKAPGEVINFSVDYSGVLASGETIFSVSSTTVIDEDLPGLTVDATSIITPNVIVTVSGGGATGTNYSVVVVRVTTSLTQTLDGAVRVCVSSAT